MPSSAKIGCKRTLNPSIFLANLEKALFTIFIVCCHSSSDHLDVIGGGSDYGQVHSSRGCAKVLVSYFVPYLCLVREHDFYSRAVNQTLIAG